MYYISSEISGKFGVTDTSDNVTEFYNVNDIFKIAERVKVTGVDLVNKKIDVQPIGAGSILSELKDGISEWRKLHNPWNCEKVKSALSKVPAGFSIVVKYTSIGTSGKRIQGRSEIVHKLDNTWEEIDKDCYFPQRTGGTDFALDCIERVSVYMTATFIDIKRNF